MIREQLFHERHGLVAASAESQRLRLEVETVDVAGIAGEQPFNVQQHLIEPLILVEQARQLVTCLRIAGREHEAFVEAPLGLHIVLEPGGCIGEQAQRHDIAGSLLQTPPQLRGSGLGPVVVERDDCLAKLGGRR